MCRSTALLALLQTAIVVLGSIALGIVLKISGYPAASALQWNPLTLLLHHYGLWLLAVPVGWLLFASSAERVDQGVLCYRTACMSALGISGGIVALYLFASIYPFTRPML